MKSSWGMLAVLLAMLSPVRANATIDAFIDFTVPYYEVQTGDICLRRHPMIGEFGIPQANVMRGTLSEAKVLVASNGQFSNINLTATQPPMVGTYVSDNVLPSGQMEYAMRLDLTALAQSNGQTVVGRAGTVRAAKLFLIAMAENMQRLSPTGWKLRVELVGLPSQTGLQGTRLYATTTYPYTGASPLIQAYRQELLNLDGTCP